jgi:hypothetical protein
VLVLVQTVFLTPALTPEMLGAVPLNQDQYQPQQETGPADTTEKHKGDVNDPDVSDANRGRIDITTSQQSALQCSI